MLKEKPTGEILGLIKLENTSPDSQYPRTRHSEISSSVYLTEQQYIFWRDVSIWLPVSAVITKGYIIPDIHAKDGITELLTKQVGYDLSRVVVNRNKAEGQSSSKADSSTFFSNISTPVASSILPSSVKKTHPTLNGKIGDYYLHQFDYILIQKDLLSLGIKWDLPYEDDYQRGLLVDIDIKDTKLEKTSILKLIEDVSKANEYLNVNKCELKGDVITVTFKTSTLSTMPFEFGILNIGSSSNVRDCFSQKTLQRIYKNLKDNGYGDLDETLSPMALRGLPKKARKKGTALATAIRDSLVDVLGGSDGVISVLQSSTNEYLMGVINGLIASNNVLYDELDRLSGGTVKKRAIEAFESGMTKNVVSKNVASLLVNGMEINNGTGRSLLATESNDTVTSNIESVKNEMQLARTLEAKAGTQTKS